MRKMRFFGYFGEGLRGSERGPEERPSERGGLDG